MIRFLLLLLIGAVTFGLVYLANHPDVFGDLWLYLIGLAGAIIKLFKVIWEKIKNLGKDLEKEISPPAEPKLPPVIQVQNQNDPVG
jgi:hypothetical protein